MSNDLMHLEASDTAALEVLHPVTSDPIIGTDNKPWTIDFAGPAHPKAIEQKNSVIRKALKETRKGKNADDKEPDDVTAEGVKFLVDRILGWTPIQFGGKPLEFSPKAATDLLSNPKFEWLYRQCNKFLADEASFIKRSTKT